MQIQTLNLSEKDKKSKTPQFWERQFQIEATGRQKFFDAVFGIVLPVACFLFDPLIFRTGNYETPLAGEYKPFAYILSFVSIMSLLAFILWSKKLKWLNGFLSGLFAVGAIFSLSIGIRLLPFSVLGLVILIGALGFTPLFTAFVYWRGAVRAYKMASFELSKNLLVRMAVLTGMFAVIVPSLINVKIQKGLNTMQTGNAAEIRRTAQRLKYVAPLVDFSSLRPIRNAEGNFTGSEENQALAESYKMLTGEEISNYYFFD